MEAEFSKLALGRWAICMMCEGIDDIASTIVPLLGFPLVVLGIKSKNREKRKECRQGVQPYPPLLT